MIRFLAAIPASMLTISDHLRSGKRYIINHRPSNQSDARQSQARWYANHLRDMLRLNRTIHLPSLEVRQIKIRRILTKILALVQGPPGTGKKYMAIQAIKVMLANKQPDDPRSSSHAGQWNRFLRHIAHFRPDFIRLEINSRQSKEEQLRSRTRFGRLFWASVSHNMPF